VPGFLYKRRVQDEIESFVGKVARLDLKTNSRTRGRFVRMVVYVDLDKPLISQVDETVHRMKKGDEVMMEEAYGLLMIEDNEMNLEEQRKNGNLQEGVEGERPAVVNVGDLVHLIGPQHLNSGMGLGEQGVDVVHNGLVHKQIAGQKSLGHGSATHLVFEGENSNDLEHVSKPNQREFV
ncbi:hypothetical protein Goklo_026929, partial [Gossypium klotzschianum]|nr:hypothetical protein [Gossypium klotzschianum]